MKCLQFFAVSTAVAVPLTALLTGGQSDRTHQVERIERGKYLVGFGGCHDCHTPLKTTAKGPGTDRIRMLSGHPEDAKLLPPNLKPGPWTAATAGKTAWAGPWGVSYAANLTPDTNTGLGIWTEEMFLKAMKTGQHMGGGRPILPPMPWQNMAMLEDDDLKDIFAYLKSIPPIANHVPAPQPSAGKRGCERSQPLTRQP